MSENAQNPFQPLLFFISKSFILAGMVLVFTFIFMGIGMFLSKWFFGVDAFSSPEILNDYNTNPAVLNSLRLIQGLNTIGGFLLPAFLFQGAINQPINAVMGVKNPPRVKYFLSALLLVLVSIPLVSWLINLNESYVFPPEMHDLEIKLRAMQDSAEALTKAFIASSTSLGLITNFLIVAILPAICEEFFFRGALMQFLMMCMRNKHLAIMLTGFLFSLFHGEFFGLLPRFVLGVVLGYIAYYSGSIWPAVAAHLLNNGMALLSSHFEWGKSGISFLEEDYIFPIYITGLSLVFTIALIYFISISEKRTDA